MAIEFVYVLETIHTNHQHGEGWAWLPGVNRCDLRRKACPAFKVGQGIASANHHGSLRYQAHSRNSPEYKHRQFSSRLQSAGEPVSSFSTRLAALAHGRGSLPFSPPSADEAGIASW